MSGNNITTRLLTDLLIGKGDLESFQRACEKMGVKV